MHYTAPLLQRAVVFYETAAHYCRVAQCFTFLDPAPTVDRPGGFRSRTRVLKIYRGPKARLTFHLQIAFLRSKRVDLSIFFVEIIFVYLLKFDGTVQSHSNAMLNHQFCEALPIN